MTIGQMYSCLVYVMGYDLYNGAVLIVMFVFVGTCVLGCLGHYLDTHGVIEEYLASGRAALRGDRQAPACPGSHGVLHSKGCRR